MIKAGITVNAGDLEQICTLSASAMDVLEPEIIKLLVNNTDAKDIIDDIDLSSNTYQDLDARQIQTSELKKFDLFTSPALKSTTCTSVLVTATDYREVEEPDSNTQNISGLEPSHNKTSQIIDPTSAFYDSNIEFVWTKNDDACYLVGYNEFTFSKNTDPSAGDWSVNFDNTNSYSNMCRAVNSEFCNQQNAHPLHLIENTVFNETYAMGQDQTHFFTVEDNTVEGESQIYGKPLEHDLAESNTLARNGLNITKKNFQNFNATLAGTYAIQTTDNIAVVNLSYDLDPSHSLVLASQKPLSGTIKDCKGYIGDIQRDLGQTPNINQAAGVTLVNGTYFNQQGYQYNVANNKISKGTTISDLPTDIVANFPLINSTNETALPTTFSLTELESLFDLQKEKQTNGEIPLPNYRFELRIEENEIAGYSFDNFALVTESDSSEPIFNLKNDNLTDNHKYIRELVSHYHKVDFNNATLSLKEDNGSLDSVDNINLFTIEDGRELLPSSLIGVTGRIALNINDPTSRVNNYSNKGPGATPIPNEQKLSVSVFYNIEDQGERDGISQDLKTTSYVGYSAQLVHKSPVDYNTKFKGTAEATLNFYSSEFGLINDNMKADDIEFDVESSYNYKDVDIFKITTDVNLVNSGSLLSNTDMSGVNTTKLHNINAHVAITNLDNTNSPNSLLEHLTNAQINFIPKSLDSLSIYTAAVEANIAATAAPETPGAWRVQSIKDSNLSSSSISAYSPNAWPTLDQTIALISDGSNINFEITNYIGNVGSFSSTSSNNMDMADIINIKWPENNKMTFHYDNTNLKRLEYITLSATNTPVDSASYTLPPSLIGKKVSLIKITSVRSYRLQVADIHLRGFTGISLTTPTITSTTTEYNLVDQITNVTYPKSSLRNVKSVSVSVPVASIDFSVMTTSVTQFSLSGTLSPDDLKDLQMKVVATDRDQTVQQDLTPWKPISSMFGIKSVFELNDSYDQDETDMADIEITLNYDSIDPSGNELALVLDNDYGYQIRLAGSYELNHTVEHFSSTASNLSDPSATTLSGKNSNYLTPNDGYSAISKWDNATYRVESTMSNGTTTLDITSNIGNTVVAKIILKNDTFLGSTAFIAFGIKDVWKVSRLAGNTAGVADFSQWFSSTQYPNLLDGNGYFIVENGVYLDRINGSDTLNMSTLQIPGQEIVFELKQDKVRVNMVGQLDGPVLYPIVYDSSAPQIVTSSGGLQFQYSSNSNYSRVLTLEYYRGYYGPQSVNQYYNVNRDKLTATFSINDEGDRLAYQTYDVYAGLTTYVNNLTNGYGGIGLGFDFNFSMLSKDDVTNYPIYTKGDDVIITLTNPSANDTSGNDTSGNDTSGNDTSGNDTSGNDTSVTILKTLHDYELYKFSGENFAESLGPLVINSSRLKLTTRDASGGVFIKQNTEYAIELYSGYSNIFYDSNYLGNPQYKSGNVSTPREKIVNWIVAALEHTSTNSLDWFDAKRLGFDINGYNVKASNATVTPSISYWVVSPPYVSLAQRSLATAETIPLDLDNNLENNTVVYIPVLGYQAKETYYPFPSETSNYPYIDPSNGFGIRSVVFNPDQVNYLTLKDISYKSAAKYSSNANIAKRNFLVEGNYVTINMFLGLKNEGNQVDLGKLVNSIPASRLLFDEGQTDNQKLIWKDKELSQSMYSSGHAVILSIRQQLGSVYQGSENDILNNTTLLPANVTVDLGSLFLTQDFQLNLPAGNGLRSNIYVPEILYNTGTGSGKIRVSKFSSASTIDFHTVKSIDQLQTTMIFNKKEYLDVAVPNIEIPKSNVLDLKNYLSTIVSDDIPQGQWTIDPSFSGIEFAQLLLYSQDTMTSLLPKIFVTQSSGAPKALVITQYPAMVLQGKAGQTILKINADGTIVAPAVTTSIILLNPTTGMIQNQLDGARLKNFLAIKSVDGYNLKG